MSFFHPFYGRDPRELTQVRRGSPQSIRIDHSSRDVHGLGWAGPRHVQARLGFKNMGPSEAQILKVRPEPTHLVNGPS